MQADGTPDPGDDALVFTGANPSRAQRLLALGVVPGLLLLVFCTVRPFSAVQLRPVEAFVPFYVTMMFATDVIIAVILFSQFSIVRSRALLVIANGYVFAALILVPYILAFPGLFEPGRALIGGLQTTAWLYILRHCGLAGFICTFAVLNRTATDMHLRGGVRRSIFLSICGTTAIVLALATLCIAEHSMLPTTAVDDVHFSGGWLYYAGLPIASLYSLAVTLLWPRRHTVLGLWLLVVAFVHLVAVPLSFFPSPSRFSVGWYTVVVINLIANSLVLIVLLVEISNLYPRVMLAVRAQRREREARLVTGDAVAAMIAHEVKQPLAAMITRAETGLQRLDQSVPDIAKAKQDIMKIVGDGHRAAGIIDSIRANFKKDGRVRTGMDINHLIRETTDVISDDLDKRRIALEIETGAASLVVTGNRTQVQQVLLNLIANAADSMAADEGDRILTVRSQLVENDEVLVSVADTGKGIDPQDLDRIFNPLFTTKTDGMGMGLSICRSIIEAHGGSIWVTPNNPKGAVFQFTLSLETG